MSTNRPPSVVTHGATAFAARCGRSPGAAWRSRRAARRDQRKRDHRQSESRPHDSSVRVALALGSGLSYSSNRDDPETLARTYVETITRVAASGGDDEVLELVHPAAELRPIITGDVHRGREGAAAWIKAAREALVWEPVIRRVVRVDDTTAVAIIHLHASRETDRGSSTPTSPGWPSSPTACCAARRHTRAWTACPTGSAPPFSRRAKRGQTPFLHVAIRRTRRSPAGRGRRSG